MENSHYIELINSILIQAFQLAKTNKSIPEDVIIPDIKLQFPSKPELFGQWSTSSVLEAAYRYTTPENGMNFAKEWIAALLNIIHNEELFLQSYNVSRQDDHTKSDDRNINDCLYLTNQLYSQLKFCSLSYGYINIFLNQPNQMNEDNEFIVSDNKKQQLKLQEIAVPIIGKISTCFKTKYAIPRQGSLVPSSRGIVEIDPELGLSYLNGLEEFSHCWLIWLFHQSAPVSGKSKIRPPKLRGEKKGIFATRSPHRPFPVGLSVVKIEAVLSKKIIISGLDIVDGTPLLDIKPYHPMDCLTHATYPKWIPGFEQPLQVSLCPKAKDELYRFVESFQSSIRILTISKFGGILPFQFFKTTEDFLQALFETLGQDPRSTNQFYKNTSKTFVIFMDNFNIYYTVNQSTVTITNIVCQLNMSETDNNKEIK